jgi:hypothetical protein
VCVCVWIEVSGECVRESLSPPPPLSLSLSLSLSAPIKGRGSRCMGEQVLE